MEQLESDKEVVTNVHILKFAKARTQKAMYVDRIESNLDKIRCLLILKGINEPFHPYEATLLHEDDVFISRPTE